MISEKLPKSPITQKTSPSASRKRESDGLSARKKSARCSIRLLVPASQTHNVHRQVFWLGSNAPADLPSFPVTSPAFAPLTAAGQHRPFTCFPFP